MYDGFVITDKTQIVLIYKYKSKGNRQYQTSPELCNPTTPFAADRPHRMRPEIFRIRLIFALAWHTE